MTRHRRRWQFARGKPQRRKFGSRWCAIQQRPTGRCHHAQRHHPKQRRRRQRVHHGRQWFQPVRRSGFNARAGRLWQMMITGNLERKTMPILRKTTHFHVQCVICSGEWITQNETLPAGCRYCGSRRWNAQRRLHRLHRHAKRAQALQSTLSAPVEPQAAHQPGQAPRCGSLAAR